MLILAYSETNAGSLRANLGESEYSYYFVLHEFRPLLERLGQVVVIQDPARDADPAYAACAARGEDCLLFSFAPPHQTTLGLTCPTIPVFAWEFDSLPDEIWGDDPRDDWRYVLGRLGRAITHSSFARQTTRRALGPDYPVISIPAPVWDRFAPLKSQNSPGGFTVTGRLIDTRGLDLAPFIPTVERGAIKPPLPPCEVANRPVALDGVVYTSVLNPNDGRKNWTDMVGGFCWAFRDVADATLVLKITNHDAAGALGAMLEELGRLSPFACRVILVDGFLGDDSYEALAAATTYTLNTSRGEGQCLPLMEYMAAGKPAIAPGHTAMADYVSPANSFVLRSTPEPAVWPHDPRQAFRTQRHRLGFGSLVTAFQDSYRVARHEPARYASMAADAHETLREHCSHAVAFGWLERFLAQTRAYA